MCQSQAEGGLRCAAHTAPRFRSATPGTPEWDTAAAEYASTRGGAVVIAAMRDAAAEEGDVVQEVALAHALAEGARRRQTAGEVRQALSPTSAATAPSAPVPAGRTGKPALTLIQGGRADESESDTFCDWCWTDPGPDGDCDCP